MLRLQATKFHRDKRVEIKRRVTPQGIQPEPARNVFP